jgi:hypothetical protein
MVGTMRAASQCCSQNQKLTGRSLVLVNFVASVCCPQLINFDLIGELRNSVWVMLTWRVVIVNHPIQGRKRETVRQVSCALC